jgi:L-iditol 2-dehydrogenase
MSDTMNAIVNHGPEDYRLEEVPKPTPGPGELLLKIDAAGICGSDGKCYSGGAMFWGDDPWVKTPVVPGHEFFGTVVEAGEGAEALHGVSIGDKAIAEQIHPCGACRYCERGQYWMCEKHDIYGFQKDVADGAWAEYMRLHRTAIVHRVPETMPLEAGVLIEPLACAIHAVERGNIAFDDVVVLAGAGTLGLLMLAAIKQKNPRLIIVQDAKPERLELARRLGADVTIDVGREDPSEVVKRHTEGYGCDVFIEATGYPAAVQQGLDAVRKLGTLVVFGVFGKPVTTDWSVIGDRKELDIFGAHLGPYRYPTAIRWLSEGKIDHASIVTDSLPLDAYQEGIDKVLRGEGIKVMLTP